MDPNRHKGKRKRSMSFGIISDLLLSRKWIKIESYNGTHTRSSHRKLIEKYKSMKDRNKVSRLRVRIALEQRKAYKYFM